MPRKPTVRDRVAGTSGEPVLDSGARAAFGMFLSGTVGTIAVLASVDPVAVVGLTTASGGAAWLLGGLYDRFMR